MNLHELELKFGIPPEMLDPLRRALRMHGARRVGLEAHYFDTVDGLLAQRRIALRLRREGGHWVQTLKAPGDGAVHHIEHALRVPAVAGAMPHPDLRRHADGPAAALLGDLLQTVPAPTLVKCHGTRISRLRCVLAVGETRIEVALDTGTASAGSRTVAICELELEHLDGPVQGLFDLAISWVHHGGLWLSTVNKAQRGERLMRPDGPLLGARIRPVHLRSDDDGATVLRAVLQVVLEQVLANTSVVAEDGGSADHVHQLRLGLRRLRTVLRELHGWSTRTNPAWDEPIARCFAQLGQQRDHEVLAALVRPLLESAHAPQLNWHAPPVPTPSVAVRESEFQITLLQVLALAHARPEDDVKISPAAVRRQLAARLARLHAEAGRRAQHFERLSIEDQHRVRKHLKRLCDLASLTAALWPRDKLRRYLQRASQARDAMGTHHDIAVAAQAFRDDAAKHPPAWFAAGWLQAHLAVTARTARKTLQKVAATPGFWKG